MTHKHSARFGLLLMGAVALALVAGISPGNPTFAQTGGTLGYGSKVYGTISAQVPVVSYSFSGSTGDFVAITAETWVGTLENRLELVAPNGEVLGTSTQNTPGGDPMGAYIEAFLPDTGIYLLRLSGDNATTGDYLLALVGRGAAAATPLIVGQAVEVTIPAGAAPQFFSFEATDCPTTLIVSEPSAGQPFTLAYVVKVRDQRGQTVARVRGGELVADWVTVEPLSGRYEVEVLAADPALAGTLRLLVTCSGDAPGCPSGQTAGAGGPGAPGCVPCPPLDQRVPGGGCPDLNLEVWRFVPTTPITTFSWDPMPGAEGYVVFVRGLTIDGGEVYLTRSEWTPGDPTEFTWILPLEGYRGYRFTLEVWAGGAVICSQQLIYENEPFVPPQQVAPCGISTDREDIWVYVGPGRTRGVFTFLPASQIIPVIGQAVDETGEAWWQIDKSVIPGSDMVISLWVAQADVIALGDCSQVPAGDVPPVIPGQDYTPPGMWLPCGSCDTCGHPANECVTSPEGLCLWDPATCVPTGPPPSGGPEEECYTITISIDMSRCPYTSGSAMLDVVPNCAGGRYLPGTTIEAHAVAVDPKCTVDYWSGCGVSGGGANISFSASSSCALVAHMSY